jgi:hypothetical protein
MIQINTNEVFELQPDGSTILVSVEEVEVNVKTTEELLKEKQDEPVIKKQFFLEKQSLNPS